MKNYLILSILGENQPSTLSAIMHALAEAGCVIIDSHLLSLGSEFAAVLMLRGNWSSLAKLEAQLKRLESLGLTIQFRRSGGTPSTPPATPTEALPYAVEVIALERPGTVYAVVDFFATRGVQVEDLVCRSYPAPHTGTAMCTINLVVGIPAQLHIALLRDEFMDFCDHLNLDAVLEPVKG